MSGTRSTQSTTQQLTPALTQSLLDSIDYVLLDIDGVLWSGEHVFDKIPETIQWLRNQKKKIRFLSNNSTMSRLTTSQKFSKKGIPGVTPEEVVTSAYAAALFLKSQSCSALGLDTNVFIVGETGLHEEIRRVLAPGRFTYGLELNNLPYEANKVARCVKQRMLPPPAGTTDPVSIESLNCGVVVAGLDFRFNMLKLSCAALCLLRKSSRSPSESTSAPQYVAAHNTPTVRYLATNEDPQLPIGNEGYLLPGAGCMINAINTVSGMKPDVVCGKPHLHMARILFEAEGIVDPRRCLMIGDRLTTDIAFGNAAGCQTMLVLSGCEGISDVARAAADGNVGHIPHFVAPSLASLMTLVNPLVAKL